MPKDLLKTWKDEHLFSHSIDCEDRTKCCLSSLELKAYVICLLQEQEKETIAICLKVVNDAFPSFRPLGKTSIIKTIIENLKKLLNQ